MLERKVRNLERWFQLLLAIMGGGRPTAPDLARKFGVSTRTIFRDVTALEDMGIPVVRDEGRYSVLDSFRLKPVQFTPEEVLALVATLDFARRRRSIGGKAAAGALDKLLAVMPVSHRELAASLDGTMVIDPIQAVSQPGVSGVEQLLQGAIQGAHPVQIRYGAVASEEPTERTVRPYGMAYRGTGLYLIGYCELRKGLRTFKVNRVLAAKPLPAVFERPSDFNLEQFLTDIWGIEDGPLMHVQIRFSPPVAKLAMDTVWHPTQQVERQPDGSALVKIETRGKNEFARWLAGYGGTAEVLAPVELREAVLKLGRSIVDRYGGADA